MQKINFMVNLCRCHLFLRNTIIVLFLKFITPKCHVNYLMFFRDIYMYLKYESFIVLLDWDLFKIGGWKRDWREDSTFYHGYISKGHLESSDGGNSCRTYPLDLPLSLYHSLFLYVQLNKQLSHIYMYLFMYYLIFISIFFKFEIFNKQHLCKQALYHIYQYWNDELATQFTFFLSTWRIHICVFFTWINCSMTFAIYSKQAAEKVWYWVWIFI